MLESSPRAVAVGDFNGDGLVDLPAVSETTGVVTMLLNQGGGDFLTPSAVTADTGVPYFADFNGDGKQDLLLDSDLIAGEGVRFGNGDGTFQAPVQMSPLNHTGMLVGDVNNDQKPDVLASRGDGISVFVNNGSGTLLPPIFLATTPGKMGLGDFNGDGKADLIMTGGTPTLRIFQGDNAGNFVLASGENVPDGVVRLTVADFNGDGKPDLLLNNASTLKYQVKLLTGVNTFGPAVTLDDGGCSALGSTTGTVGDFNQDGKLDIAAPAQCSNGTNMAVYGGNGTGAFSLLSTFATPPNARDMAVADFDGDGHLDIGTICIGEYSVALGNGLGQFSVIRYAVGPAGSNAAVAEITRDGIPDVVFSYGTPVTTAGTFLLKSRANARGRVTADFDGDGRTDISVFRPSTGIWYIIRSSDNTFYGVQFGQNGDIPVPGDYDADGKTDIAVFRPAGSVWYILRSTDGSFFAAQHGTTGDIPVPADYDGNGSTDIAVYRPSTGYWYTSVNAVQFGAAGDIPTQADFDGDGRADVAVFRPSAGVWYSLRTSEGFQQVSFGINGDRPAPLDYDGDGKANIAVFRPSNGFWYTSTNPATNFGAIQWGLSTDVMVPGYYDGDARADVGVYRTGDWYVLNTATPTYDHFYFGAAGDIPIPLTYIPQ